MNDDLNPENEFQGALPAAGNDLSEMLEELVQRRASQDGALPPGTVPVAAPVDGEGVSSASPGRCPEPGEWVLLLDKDPHPTDFEKSSVLLAHAAGCKACAQRLRMLSANESLEESATLAGLGSATAERQRKLALELARTPRAGKTRSAVRLYLWMGA